MQVGHHEVASIWPALDADSRVRVVVVTGEGAAFCAGGELAMIERAMSDTTYLLQMHEEARALCHNMVNMSKIIISAINGAAVGSAATRTVPIRSAQSPTSMAKVPVALWR